MGRVQKEKVPDLLAVVDKAIAVMADKLGSEEVKTSIPDLIRLVQLRGELAGERPGPVSAGWVQEWDTVPTSR
jgi:hypothetical protein